MMSASANTLAMQQLAGPGILNSKVLILNRSYLPVHVTSVKRAFALLYQGVARAVDEQYHTFDFASWRDLAIETHHERLGVVGGLVRVPRVLLLTAYERVPRRHVRFSRFNIFARDGNTCQYCGRRFGAPNSTLTTSCRARAADSRPGRTSSAPVITATGARAGAHPMRRGWHSCASRCVRTGRHSAPRCSASSVIASGCRT